MICHRKAEENQSRRKSKLKKKYHTFNKFTLISLLMTLTFATAFPSFAMEQDLIFELSDTESTQQEVFSEDDLTESQHQSNSQHNSVGYEGIFYYSNGLPDSYTDPISQLHINQMASGIKHLIEILSEELQAPVEVIQEIKINEPQGSTRHLLKVKDLSGNDTPIYLFTIHDSVYPQELRKSLNMTSPLSAEETFSYVCYNLNQIEILSEIHEFIKSGHFGIVFGNKTSSQNINSIVKMQFFTETQPHEGGLPIYEKEIRNLQKLTEIANSFPLTEKKFFPLLLKSQLINFKDLDQSEFLFSNSDPLRVYDFFNHIGMVGIIEQEKVPGENFKTFISKVGLSKSNQLSSELLIEIAKQFTVALDSLHVHGVFHLDFKAENLMIYLEDKHNGTIIEEPVSTVMRQIMQEEKNILDSFTVKVNIIDFGIAEIETDKEKAGAPRRYSLGFGPIHSPQANRKRKTFIRNYDTWALGLFMVHLATGTNNIIPKGGYEEPPLDPNYYSSYGAISEFIKFLKSENFKTEVRAKEVYDELKKAIYSEQ